MRNRLLVALLSCVAVIVSACGGASTADTATTPPPTVPTTSQPSPSTTTSVPATTQTSPPETTTTTTTTTVPDPFPYLSEIVFYDEGITPEVLYHSPLIPFQVNVSPDDDVLALNKLTPDIYRLLEGGEIELWRSIDPEYGDYVQHFDFGPDGAMWFSSPNGVYREEPDGTFRQVSTRARQTFSVGPDGAAYAVGDEILRITASGPDETIARLGDAGKAPAITDEGVMFLIDSGTGELVRVQPDGTLEVILGGLGGDYAVRIAPDGRMYLIEQRGLWELDPDTGTITEVEWMIPYRNIASDAVFDPDGILYLFGGQIGVFRVDLEAESLDVAFVERSNSDAMAASPDGRAFVAFGPSIPGAEVELHEIVAPDELRLIATFPYRHPGGITFGPDGRGYISVGWPSDQLVPGRPGYESGIIVAFDPDTGETETIYENPGELPNDVAIDPITGTIWWAGGDGFFSLDAAGAVKQIPYPEPNARRGELEITPDGTFVARLDWAPSGYNTANQVLFQRKPGGEWEEIYDGRGSSDILHEFTACPNGDIYLTGGTHQPELYLSGDVWPGIPVTFRLDEGSLVPAAHNAGIDPYVMYCHPDTGDIYYTHALGVIRWTFDQ